MFQNPCLSDDHHRWQKVSRNFSMFMMYTFINNSNNVIHDVQCITSVVHCILATEESQRNIIDDANVQHISGPIYLVCSNLDLSLSSLILLMLALWASVNLSIISQKFRNLQYVLISYTKQTKTKIITTFQNKIIPSQHQDKRAWGDYALILLAAPKPVTPAHLVLLYYNILWILINADYWLK